jgi:8-oxo-dGTP diphosphatase
VPDPSLRNHPRFCLNCGTLLALQSVRGERRPVCPTCSWVYYADPKVAVAVLLVASGKVLLVRRAIRPGLGRWSLPAGFLNAGEDPAKAARRECREESGLDVAVEGLLTVQSGREHPRGADLLLVYRARLRGGALVPGDDASAARWFPLTELPPIAFRSTRRILAAFAQQTKR